MLVRHMLLFLVPICLAVSLPLVHGQSTAQYIAQSDQLSEAILNRNAEKVESAFSALSRQVDAEIMRALEDLEQGNFTQIQRAERVTTALTVAVFWGLAFLIPPRATPQSVANCLTTLTVGFCAAKLLIGFHFLAWPEFLAVSGIGFAGAAAIELFRGRKNRTETLLN